MVSDFSRRNYIKEPLIKFVNLILDLQPIYELNLEI